MRRLSTARSAARTPWRRSFETKLGSADVRLTAIGGGVNSRTEARCRSLGRLAADRGVVDDVSKDGVLGARLFDADQSALCMRSLSRQADGVLSARVHADAASVCLGCALADELTSSILRARIAHV